MTRLVLFHPTKGVGKTMLTTNIADALRDLGHRVLMVDVDPERVLTSFYLDAPTLDVLLQDVVIAPVKIVAGLYLSPAHDHLRAQQSAPSAITVAATRDAAAVQADVIVYDVGASTEALAQTALLDADFFLVPMTRTRDALGGLEGLGQRVADWVEACAKARESQKTHNAEHLPKGRPVFIGYVVSEVGSQGIDDAALEEHVQKQVVEPLKRRSPNLLIESPKKLGNVRDYGVLANAAYEAGFPVVKLRGHVDPSSYPLIDDAITEFRELAKAIKVAADL